MTPITLLSRAADPGAGRTLRPSTLVIIISVAVFTIEIVEEPVFDLLPPMSRSASVLLDALVMISALSVLLYLFLMHPLMDEIRLRKRAESELRSVNTNLEALVDERTKELISANKRLVAAIDEQEAATASLQQNNAFVHNVFNHTGCLLLAFDATSRRCVYVNDRIEDVLGYDPDWFAGTTTDVGKQLLQKSDFSRFVASVADVVDQPSLRHSWGSYSLLREDRRPIKMYVGLSAIDRTPSQQARTVLMSAIPAVD